jgi:hypothetical protein
LRRHQLGDAADHFVVDRRELHTDSQRAFASVRVQLGVDPHDLGAERDLGASIGQREPQVEAAAQRQVFGRHVWRLQVRPATADVVREQRPKAGGTGRVDSREQRNTRLAGFGRHPTTLSSRRQSARAGDLKGQRSLENEQ